MRSLLYPLSALLASLTLMTAVSQAQQPSATAAVEKQDSGLDGRIGVSSSLQERHLDFVARSAQLNREFALYTERAQKYSEKRERLLTLHQTRDLDARTRTLHEEHQALLRERERLSAASDRLAGEHAALQLDREALMRTRTPGDERDPEAHVTHPDYVLLQADVEQLRRERDALHQEAERLRRLLRQDDPATARTEVRTSPAYTGAVSLPGFSLSRLQNASELEQRLNDASSSLAAEPTTPSGNVLVLFVTDATGRVVEAEVATPLDGRLDTLALDLVRAMHFVPPVISDRPSVLRSQVAVRFGP